MGSFKKLQMAARRPTKIQLAKLEAQYQLGDYLASGGCGTVMLCTKLDDANKKKYILKYINLNELTKNKAAGSQREANLMKKLNNDNIVRLIGVFECDGKLHLIMEYCQGGDLRALIRKKLHEEEYFSYNQIRTWMIQLCKGLEAVHEAEVVHRDIKPENIFVGDSQKLNLKIGDLGISRVIDTEKNERAKTRIGTPRYVSPEVLQGKEYLFSTDIWSLGIMLVEIVTLDRAVIKPEKHERNFCGLCSCGTVSTVEVPQFKERLYGTELHKIAKMMLTEKPSKRPTASQLVKLFSDLPER